MSRAGAQLNKSFRGWHETTRGWQKKDTTL